jgi:hypothetical protein
MPGAVKHSVVNDKKERKKALAYEWIRLLNAFPTLEETAHPSSG